jgi:hypothetical protein
MNALKAVDQKLMTKKGVYFYEILGDGKNSLCQLIGLSYSSMMSCLVACGIAKEKDGPKDSTGKVPYNFHSKQFKALFYSFHSGSKFSSLQGSNSRTSELCVYKHRIEETAGRPTKNHSPFRKQAAKPLPRSIETPR